MPAALAAGVWEDYYALLEKYRRAGTIRGTVVTGYYYKEKAAPLKKEKGYFFSDGPNKYVNYGDVILLNNEAYSITLDKRNKVLMVSNAPGRETVDELTKAMQGPWKDSAEQRKRVVLVNTVNDTDRKVFEMNIKEGQYEKIIYEFSGSSGLIRKITYVFRKQEQFASNPTRVEVEYRDLMVNVPVDKNTFSEKSLVRIKKDEVIPAEGYRNYSVLDYRKLQKYGK